MTLEGRVSRIPSAVSSDRPGGEAGAGRQLMPEAWKGRLPGTVPLFRSRSHFRVPSVKPGPLIAAVVAVLLIGGLVALAVVEPRPPLKRFEVPVPNERLSR